MTTKNYFIENTKKACRAIAEVKRRIPCFVEDTYTADGFIEVEIQCRDADLAFVEKMLAEFV